MDACFVRAGDLLQKVFTVEKEFVTFASMEGSRVDACGLCWFVAWEGKVWGGCQMV